MALCKVLKLAPIFAAVNLASIASAEISTNPSNLEITRAMGIADQYVVSVDTKGSDGTSLGIISQSLGIIDNPKDANDPDLLYVNAFPLEGSSFFAMSTGDISIAADENSSESAGSTLGGIDTPPYEDNSGTDLSQVELVLQAPENAVCASFDFIFYSEEYNEYVGSDFNDAFLAELTTSDITITKPENSNYIITSPNNFAFDTSGNFISINSTFTPICDINAEGTATTNCDTGTTYDNATVKLRANTPVTGGQEETIILSIMDVGDSAFDSAVFIDNFLWKTEPCAAGAEEIDDQDGDGLLDPWESTSNLSLPLADGSSITIDLPSSGANSSTPDIYIELDYMQQDGVINYKPSPEVLQKVIDAFDAVGINAHIDAGPDSLMDPMNGNSSWGANSQSNSIPFQNGFGSGNFNWTQFDEIKAANFSKERQHIFHYGLIVHKTSLGGVTAISRDYNASDFIVALGDVFATETEQAGSILKAIGHNLALSEGGRDNYNYKPHYLSVMNPLYNLDGLIYDGVDGNLFFSNVPIDAINEQAINESIVIPNATGGESHGIKHNCGGNYVIKTDASQPVDWNCNSQIDSDTIVQDIDGKDGNENVLKSYNDRNSMRFSGGLIGKNDAIITLPTTTSNTYHKQSAPFDISIPSSFEVSVIMESYPSISLGGTQAQQIYIRNRGSNDDNYTVSCTTVNGTTWADCNAITGSYNIEANRRLVLELPVSVQTSGSEKISITVTSETHASILDRAYVDYDAATATATASAGAHQTKVLFEDGNPFKQSDDSSGSFSWMYIMLLNILLVLRIQTRKAGE